jgi:cell division protein FtsL
MAAVDWFGAGVAAPAPARPPRPRTRPRPRPVEAPPARARTQRRAAPRRLTGGILWISVFAVLLAGVVALNVAVLRLNMSVSKLDQQELQLRAENQALASEVSKSGSAQRIEATAHKLGLVPAPATDTSYIDLGRR